MAWIKIVMLIITYGPMVLKLIRELFNKTGSISETGQCIGDLCHISDGELAKLRDVLRKRRIERRTGQ